MSAAERLAFKYPIAEADSNAADLQDILRDAV